MDLEIASEFVQMASHLLYIKTKTLLAGGEEEVSELELLMASLEQLKCKDIFSAVQKITPELKKASELGLLYYAKMPEPEPGWAKEYKYNHEPVDLLKALYAVYSRGGKTPEREDNISSAIPKRINFSVKDKSRHIIEQLKASKLKLDDLYTGCHSRSEIVATFVAVLELCSMGSISISIKDNCYELEFVGGNVDEIIEKIVE